MSTRTTRQQEQSNDLKRGLTLLFWAACFGALLLSSTGWSPLNGALKPLHGAFKKSEPKVAELQPSSTGKGSGHEVYTGSIVFVPSYGDDCWERMLDNRTGVIWDKGRIDCYDYFRQSAEPSPGRSMSGERMLAISRALRGEPEPTK